MRIVTRREAIENSITQFLETYGRYPADKPMQWTAGKPLGYYVDRVRELDPKTCHRTAFNAAIGKQGWVENRCNECGGDFENVIRFGDEPDYEARWQDLCVGCMEKAIASINSC